MRSRLTALVAFTGLFYLASACSDAAASTGPESPLEARNNVASITVTPASASIAVGGTVQLTAVVRDNRGNVVSNRTVTWTTANGAIATVSASGLVTGVAAGSTSITATASGRSASSAITVTAPTTTEPTPTPTPTPAPVASVSVTPSSATLAIGQGTQLSATLKDSAGTVLTNRTVTWATSNAGIATVSATGYVTAVAAGTATVTATSEGKSGSSAITVSAPTTTPTTGTLETIFADGFESGSLSNWDDNGVPTSKTIISTPSRVYSGSRALQITYPSGSDAGWLTKFFMPGYDSVYVRYYIKLDSTWTSGTKLVNLGGSRIDNQWSAMGKAGVCPNGTDFFNATLTGDPSPQMRMRFYTNYYGMSTSNGCFGVNGPSSAYTPDPFQLTSGTWHKIEFWVKINTPGQANGLQQFWVDGVLHGSWSGITFRTTTDLRLNSVTISASSPGGTSQVRYLWIDDFLVAKQRP